MDAPRCIVCGQRHWSTQPCPAFADVAAEERRQQTARSVTKPKGGRPLLGDKPMTAAERMRAYRARQKPASELNRPQGSLTSPSSF